MRPCDKNLILATCIMCASNELTLDMFIQSSSLLVASKNIPGVCFEVSVDVCESEGDCTWDFLI